MKKIIYAVFVLTLLCGYETQAQITECGCTNCPLNLPDGESDTLFLNVLGIVNDNLASPSQGVCGVRLTFVHQWLGDLNITLISPSGQEVQLIGPAGFHGPTDGTSFDINFVPCSVNTTNVFGLDEFNSNPLSVLNSTIDGTYHPAGNPNLGGAALTCLEDFDTGSVNGEWMIFIDDVLALDEGIFQDFEITFCDQIGLSDCALNPCGVFAELEGPTFLCEDFDGDLILDASGSQGTQFSWDAADGGSFDGIPSGPIVNILTPGTYFLTVSDPDDGAGTCLETATWVVPNFNPVPEIGITQNGMLSCDNPEITLESSSDLPGNQALVFWVQDGDIDNGIPTENLTVTEPGVYELTVVNLFTGCSTTEAITITDESTFPTAEIEDVEMISCTNTSVSINSSSDTNGVDFSWQGPNNFTSTDQSFDVTEPGTYFLEVSDPNSGCMVIDSIEILADTIPPIIEMISSTNDIDCTTTTSTLSIGTSETPDNIAWTGPNGFTSDTASPEVNEGGIYTVIVSGANGCTSESTIEIDMTAELPDISIADDGLIDCNNMEFELTGNSTTDNVTFEWTGPNSFTSDQANPGMVTDTGTYLLIVTAPNGCSTMSEVFINADTLTPTLTLDAPDLLGCDNTTTTLTGAPDDAGFTYAWSGPNGQTFTDAEPTVEGSGDYDLVVTAANGCTNSFSIFVDTDDTEPDVSIMAPAEMLTCNETELALINTSDPANTYAWTGPNGFTSMELEPLVDEAGDYTVIVTGANGCTSTDMVSVQIDTLSPDINFTTAELTCTENIVSIGVNSTETIVEYAWTGVGGYTSSEQNPNDISEGGSYTAVITAENGCTNSITFDVEESMDMPDGNINAAAGNTLSCNLNALDLTADGVTPGSTLSWLDPTNTPISTDTGITADAIGTYTLIITAPNGCERTVDVLIDEDMDGPVVTDNPDVDLLCLGDVSIGISSNDNIVDFAWSGPNGFSSINPNPTVGAEGTYTVELTGDNGCTSTATVSVFDRQEMPDIFVDDAQTLVCGVDQLTINGGSAEPNVTYTWTTPNGSIVGPINGPSLDLNSQGTYVLTITNLDNGCEASAEVMVDQDNNTPNAEIVAEESLTLDCITTSITLNATGSDNGAGFSFAWGNMGGTPIDTETNLQTTITEQGSYFITVTNDANQCTSIASITIGSEIDAPQLELSPLEELNCNVMTLGIENIGINSVNGLEYNWQVVTGGNITTPTDMSSIEVDMPGTYTVVLTNPANGCTSEMPFEITQDIATPVVNAGQNATLVCGVSAIPLAGSLSSSETDIDIIWTSTNGVIIGGADTFTPEVGAAGTYTLTVINNENGCEATSEVVVEQDNNIPIAEIIAEESLTINCNTTSITLNATGSDNGAGFSFVWGNMGGTPIDTETNLQTTITEQGSYFITITNDANQCTSIASVTIDSDMEAPQLELSPLEELNCNVTTLGIENVGINTITGLEYDWQAVTGGNITTPTDMSSIEVDMAGTYTVVLTNPANGCTSETPFEITQNFATPMISAGQDATLDCGVSALPLAGSLSSNETNIDVIWTSADGVIISGEDTFTPEVSAAGTYTLTVTNNDNGCSNESQVTIDPNMDLPIIEIATAVDFTCNTPSLILDASNSSNGPGINYSWTSTSGANIFNGDGPNPEIFEPGEYILTISNTNNNCESTNAITVGADTLSPIVVVDQADNLSCTVNELDLGISSDLSNLDIAWTALTGNIVNGETTATPRVDQAGTYEVVVTSTENQCTASAIVEVNLDDNTPTAAIALPEELNCNQTQITLDAGLSSQGNNITLLWENDNGNFVSGEDGLTPVVDMPGLYTLTIMDNSNGCIVSQSVTVTENMDLPEVNIDQPSMLNCLTLSTTVQAINTGGSTFEYEWQTTDGNILSGANTLNPEIDAAGSYQLTALDTENGCTNTFDITVLEDIAPPAVVVGDDLNITCQDPTALVSGMGSSEGTEFLYEWTDANNNVVATTLETTFDVSGTFTLEIVNTNNGCSDTAVLRVDDVRETPEIIVATPETITCDNPIVSLNAQDVNGENLEYTWMDENGNVINTDNTDSDVDVDLSGSFSVLIVNPLNGCDTTISVFVDNSLEDPEVEVMASNAGEISCEFPEVQLTGTINGLNEDEVSFVWQVISGNILSGENTLTPIVNAQGTYQLMVINLSNGCSNMQEVNITQDDAIPLATLNTPLDLNCEVLETTLTIPNNVGNIDIVWTLNGNPIPNATTNELTVTDPGDYSVTIANLDNGCTSVDFVTVTQDITEPVIDAGLGFELQCNATEFQIQGTGDGNPNNSIVWDAGTGNIIAGENTLTPTTNAPGTYTLTVTNEDNGCVSTDAVIVTQNTNIPFDILLTTLNPLCEDDLGTINILEVLGGDGPFDISIDGGVTFSDQTLYEDLVSGDYEISVLDANECPFVLTTTINSSPAIGVDLPAEIELLLGDSATLNANLSNIDVNDIQTIRWTPSTGLSCDDCLNPTILSTASDINYELEVILSSGCSAVDNIQLRVDRNLDVFVPDAFSPYNLDGINDEFYLFARDRAITNINSFAIFDRWGNQVFLREDIQPNDPSEGWRGEFRGERFNPGVFIYVIEVEFRTGNTEIIKGNVTLVE